jgi:RNA polymerase primary sigma factor
MDAPTVEDDVKSTPATKSASKSAKTTKAERVAPASVSSRVDAAPDAENAPELDVDVELDEAGEGGAAPEAPSPAALQQLEREIALARQAKPKRADQATTGDHLATYFRDLSGHDLLDPDQEREIAQGIEDQEILTWERLLGNPAAVEHVIGLLEARLDNSLKVFAEVRKAAAVARKLRTAKSREKLRQMARTAAEQLRALDLDRTHVDAVIQDLERIHDAPGPRDKDKGFAQTAAFTQYLAHVTAAARGGANLRNEFVRANLRLVVTMARRYDRGGMPLADLIQEGNLGLMHAVNRFDYRRGLRFSTYACWWIRHAIGRALADKARAVRIPVHMLEAQQQLHKVHQQLIGELGREPSPAELAVAAKVPMAKLNQMHRYLMGSPMSLDRPMHDDDDRAFGEMLADPASEDASPAEDMTTKALAARVSKLLGGLSPIEADVLRQRFGLHDDEERTFREIGDQYQLSRERIRQIQNSALDKLKRALERDIR